MKAPHLRPGLILLVAVGGTCGALSRYAMNHLLPTPTGWPLPTLLVNLAGAFGLGLLLEALARRGPERTTARSIRLLLGTGFLGAFTTYSTLAVDAVVLFDSGRTLDAFSYLAASLIGGVLAAFAGIVLAGTRARNRP